MNKVATIAAPTTPVETAGEEARLDELLADVAAFDMLTQHWPAEFKKGAATHAQAIDTLNAEAFRRLIRALKDVPGFAGVLRDVAGDEVVYAVLRRHNILKASLAERVDIALRSVRPMLESHGGDVEVVAIDLPRIDVRFLGACDGCPASALTFYSGVKKAIQDAVPEITEVKQVKGLGNSTGGTVHFTSPFANYKAEGWSFAMKLSELAKGETAAKVIDGQSLLFTRLDDSITCFANACAHMGMPLDGGTIAGGIITCPYHGFQYALESGECLTAPEVQLQPHGVRVVGDRVEVRLTR